MPSILKLIVTVFFLTSLPGQVYALTPAQVFDKVKDSIVVVKTLDAKGKVTRQGSGVLIPSGKIATNCHVVGGGASYQVGRGKQLASATLFAEDGDKDICLLDAKGIQGKPAQLGKAANLKVGDPVYAVGAPMGLEFSLSDGIVAQLRGGPPPFVQTTAAISPGSSGGGLFDREGRLIGLTTLYVEGGQSLNFAIPVEWIGEVKPGFKRVTDGRSLIEWWKRGIALEKMKDWQGLLYLCSTWTKKEPKNFYAWYGLGHAYVYLNRYEEALEAYRQALRINPDDADAWYFLGGAYQSLNRDQEAIDAYRQALNINPNDAHYWYKLGLAYHYLKSFKEAVEAYRQSLRINPDDAHTWCDIGSAYSGLERFNDTVEAYRQALRINPDNALSWCDIGNAYISLKRYNDANDAYRQALRVDPEFTIAWYFLGISYAYSGNRTAAIEAVQKLRRLDPEMAEKLFNVIVPR